MALVTVKSDTVISLEATPLVIPSVQIFGGKLRQIVEKVSVTDTDDDGSIYIFAPVRTSDRIAKIEVMNTVVTGGTDYDIGLYTTAGVAVVKDCYANGISMATGRSAPVEVSYGDRGIGQVKNQVWQDAGLTSDPQLTYYLALTGNTVGTASGTISTLVTFVRD